MEEKLINSGNIDMNYMMNQKGNHALHAVMVPFPAQGHVNAFMNLAQLLAIRGVFITFVTTDWIYKRMVEASKNGKSFVARDEPELEQQGRRIRFLSIPDGLPPNHGRLSRGDELVLSLQKIGPSLEDLLRAADEKSSAFPPITFMVTDSFMSCTEQVASNMKVPRVIFWPICAAASISQCYANFLLSEGYIPVNVREGKNPENLITCLPGNIPPLRPTDLLSAYRIPDPSNIVLNAILSESQQSKGDYVLVNTFEDLEGRDAVTALSSNGCPALGIGPAFLPNFLEGRDSCSSLWEEEEERCLRWLDTQQPGSVVYVSFGSIAIKSEQQLEQLALGLEASGQPFLWVLRLDNAEQAPRLPVGIEERTKERGMFVSWAPQLKVLAHASVGLFLTHSGWNSTLETMSMGVPVVGFPHIADQFLNCRFSKEVWKIGRDFEDVDVDVHKVVTKEEVENVVRRMMETPEGKKLRENVLRLKESAAKAVLPGGSSFLNLNTFVKDMMSGKEAQSKTEIM